MNWTRAVLLSLACATVGLVTGVIVGYKAGMAEERRFTESELSNMNRVATAEQVRLQATLRLAESELSKMKREAEHPRLQNANLTRILRVQSQLRSQLIEGVAFVGLMTGGPIHSVSAMAVFNPQFRELSARHTVGIIPSVTIPSIDETTTQIAPQQGEDLKSLLPPGN